MARISTIHCLKCKETKEVSHASDESPPTVCGSCTSKELEAAKEAARLDYFEGVMDLPEEERLPFLINEVWELKNKPEPMDIRDLRM